MLHMANDGSWNRAIDGWRHPVQVHRRLQQQGQWQGRHPPAPRVPHDPLGRPRGGPGLGRHAGWTPCDRGPRPRDWRRPRRHLREHRELLAVPRQRAVPLSQDAVPLPDRRRGGPQPLRAWREGCRRQPVGAAVEGSGEVRRSVSSTRRRRCPASTSASCRTPRTGSSRT